MTFTNYNMTCVHCGRPVDYEEQVYCEECEEDFNNEDLEVDYEDDIY